jgi:hypothetical protein
MLKGNRAVRSRCGAAWPSRSEAPPRVYGTGCLDSDAAVKPALHIHVGSKTPWSDVTDSLPRREAGLRR